MHLAQDPLLPILLQVLLLLILFDAQDLEEAHVPICKVTFIRRLFVRGAPLLIDTVLLGSADCRFDTLFFWSDFKGFGKQELLRVFQHHVDVGVNGLRLV